MSTTAQNEVRELDRRVSDGFDVRLLWNSRTDCVFVAIEDQRENISFEFQVDSTTALEAFHHPFAYASNFYDLRSHALERCPAAGGAEGPA
jgi:hypothetical protein